MVYTSIIIIILLYGMYCIIHFLVIVYFHIQVHISALLYIPCFIDCIMKSTKVQTLAEFGGNIGIFGLKTPLHAYV